jgi:DNA uptake protein ComE-like DNA-binding protein
MMDKTGMFRFSMQSRNGFLALFLLIWVVINLLPWIIFLDDEDEEIPVFQVYDTPQMKKASEEIPPNVKVNANRVDIPTLLALSVPDFLAERWINYLKKGGRFRKVEDVKKIYGMTLPLYTRLSGHLFVKNHYQRNEVYPQWQSQASKCKILDINEADSAAWESLYGIGPYLAKRITLFRESLGGFISIEQVKETYGLRDSVFQSIRPCLVLKTVIYPSLSINHSTLETLGKHPYIRYKLARNICLYRENNGFFANVEQLKAIPAINDSIFMKIKPYLTIEAVGE